MTSEPKPFAVRVAVVFAAVGAAALIVVAAQVWLLIFAGLLFAVLLDAAAGVVARVTGMPRGVALAATVTFLSLGVGLAGFALWPSVSEQADELARQLPVAWEDLRGWVAQRGWGPWVLGRGGDMVEGSRVVNQATGAIASSLNALAALVIILFVGLYVAAQPSLYHRGLRRLAPPRARRRLDVVLFELTSVLRWWLIGKLLSMTLVGVLTTVGLWVLGVPLALTFGLLAAVLTFVPNFGPILSVVPPALIALADDPQRALYVVLLYLAIQAVESYAITPLIQRRTVSMPPALTITSQVLLGVLVGVAGIAVATPLTAAAMTAIRILYVEDLLERPAAVPGSAQAGASGS